jgi:hypothetical protein
VRHLDHHALYHGTAGVLPRLQGADALLLGNSRLMFALARSQLQVFFASRGFAHYYLGFGHTEQNVFPEAVIRRHDLRPTLVIVNADEFFTGERSDWAERVMRDDWFGAVKLQAEADAAHAVRRRLHAVLPHFVEILDARMPPTIYRSRRDGSWFVDWDIMGGARVPALDLTRPHVPMDDLAEARRFALDMRTRGAAVVLCLVPAPGVSLPRAQLIAAHIGAPLIAPSVADLRTIDASHLTEESAGRFTKAFLAELDAVMRQLGVKPRR